MSDKKKLVVVVTNGFNDERSSVAWSVANGAIGSDIEGHDPDSDRQWR
jgi:hypothetical protein